MDAREEISRWLALLVQLSSEAESDQIDGDIKMLTGVTLQLSSELAKRNAYLAKQCRPNKPTISQKASQNGSQKEKGADSSNVASGDEKGAQKKPEGLSGITQGVHQAAASLDDEHRAALGKAYGDQSDDVAFLKAAKAIAL